MNTPVLFITWVCLLSEPRSVPSLDGVLTHSDLRSISVHPAAASQTVAVRLSDTKCHLCCRPTRCCLRCVLLLFGGLFGVLTGVYLEDKVGEEKCGLPSGDPERRFKTPAPATTLGP